MPLPAWCAKLKRVASVDSWTALPTRGCLGAAGVRGDNNGFAAAFLREVLTFAAGCLAAGCLAAGWFAFAFGTDGWGSATEELELEELDEELEEPEVDEALGLSLRSRLWRDAGQIIYCSEDCASVLLQDFSNTVAFPPGSPSSSSSWEPASSGCGLLEELALAVAGGCGSNETVAQPAR